MHSPLGQGLGQVGSAFANSGLGDSIYNALNLNQNNGLDFNGTSSGMGDLSSQDQQSIYDLNGYSGGV